MTEERNRAPRAKKTTDAVIGEPSVLESELPKPQQTMTFAEVSAWNRQNADKLPPAISLERKPRPKSKRI